MSKDKGDWELVYTSAEEYKILIVKELLEEENIKSYEINKRDSSYLFGTFELYVLGADVIRAKLIIQKSGL